MKRKYLLLIFVFLLLFIPINTIFSKYIYSTNLSFGTTKIYKEYNITIDYKGGSGSNPTTYNYTSPDITLNEPTRIGYIFLGYTGSNGTTAQKSVTIAKGETGDKNYVANWEPKKITVYFHPNGGSGTDGQAQIFTYGVSNQSFANKGFSRTGYTQGYWAESSTGSGQYTTNSNVIDGFIEDKYKNTNHRVDLYATWKPTNYTISIDYRGSSGTNPTSYNIESNTITLNNPNGISGYTFSSYSGSNNINSGAEKYTQSNPLTINGRDNIIGNEFSVIPGHTYRVYASAKRTKGTATLNGGIWYTAQTSGYYWDSFSAFHWADGSIGSNGYTRYYIDITVPAGKSKGKFYIQLDQGTDSSGNLIFSNGSTTWQVCEMDILDKSKMSATIPKSSTGNKSYRANWIINQYTAYFNGNGGSNGTAIKKNYGTQLGTLPSSSRTGYTFTGWYTASTGGTKISTTTTMPAGNVTYYAHWSINQYYVDVNPMIQGTKYNGGKSGFTFSVYLNGTKKATNVTDWSQKVNYGTKVRVVANNVSGYAMENNDVTKTVGTSTVEFIPKWYKYTAVSLKSYLELYATKSNDISYTFNTATGIYNVKQTKNTPGWGTGSLCDATGVQVPWGKTNVFHFEINTTAKKKLYIDPNLIVSYSVFESDGVTRSHDVSDCKNATRQLIVNGTTYNFPKTSNNAGDEGPASRSQITLDANKWYSIDLVVPNNNAGNTKHETAKSTPGFGFDLRNSTSDLTFYVKNVHTYNK